MGMHEHQSSILWSMSLHFYEVMQKQVGIYVDFSQHKLLRLYFQKYSKNQGKRRRKVRFICIFSIVASIFTNISPIYNNYSLSQCYENDCSSSIGKKNQLQMSNLWKYQSQSSKSCLTDAKSLTNSYKVLIENNILSLGRR